MKTQKIYIYVKILLTTAFLPCWQLINAAKEVDSSLVGNHKDSLDDLSTSDGDIPILDNQKVKSKVFVKKTSKQEAEEKLKLILQEESEVKNNNKKRVITLPDQLTKLVSEYCLLSRLFQGKIKGIGRDQQCRLIRLFVKKCKMDVLKKQIYGNQTIFEKARNQKWTHGCLLLLHSQLISYKDCLTLGEYYNWGTSNKKNIKRLFDKRFIFNNDKDRRLPVKAIVGAIRLIDQEFSNQIRTSSDHAKIASAMASMTNYTIKNANKHFFQIKKITNERSKIESILKKLKEFQPKNEKIENKNNESDSDSDGSENESSDDDNGGNGGLIDAANELKLIETNLEKIANLDSNIALPPQQQKMHINEIK